eukprot:SAG11_NODE_3360_length_2500_cov_685.903374_3_plen_102_part_01
MKQVKMKARAMAETSWGTRCRVLGGLRQMVQEARAAVDRWQRRVVATEDSGGVDDDLLLFDDMLADAEDWLSTCSWVLAEATAELRDGRPGQFCELGATLVE